MKKAFKKLLYTILALVILILVFGLILAFLPIKYKTDHKGISTEEAATLRKNYTGPHHEFITTDGETLFLRRWNPDSLIAAKKDIAVLIFHGFTAYSGAYNMAGEPISKGGYTTFGLDYRGHGLSGGNRGDVPNKDRWIADLAESVKYIKSLGFSKVIVLGHSLGVAAAMCAEGRKGLSTPPSFFEKTRLLASLLFRPSYQAAEYYRKGMTVPKDSLFTFRYTVRFLTMLNVKKLRLVNTLNIPVLVGAGDQDELFEVDKVRELYDLVPGDKKEFLIMKNTTHAKIPVESWQQVVVWLDKIFLK